METAGLIKLLNVVALVVLMLSIGLTVQPAQVLVAARQVRLVLLGVLANFVLTPLITVGLLVAFDAVPLVAAGFLILAVCPGAPVGPTFTGIARGDVAAATGLMVILAGLSAILTPLLLTVLLGWLAPGSDLRIDFVAITATLLVTQLLPLAVGLTLHHAAPHWSARAARPFRLTANLLLLVVVALILASQYPTLGAIRPRGWFGMLLLLAASLGIGWLCGGPGPATRRALAVTTGVRNAAVGLVIAGDNFAGTPAVTAVVAYALVSIFGTLGCAFWLGRSTPENLSATVPGGSTR
ncbi:MAG: bile acid:sodium symporter [Planctomycetia bacterium]|nr:bile acid:sodium symporter [Planctomycetia bacterium]